jgi:hypothetical protein
MQNIAKRLLGTNTDTLTDLVSLRARHGDAARKVAQGVAELERLTADVDRLRLQRARLIDQRDSEEGTDLFVPIRAAEGALATAQKRWDDLQDIQRVRQATLDALAAEVRAAEQAAAPGRMRALAAEHAEERAGLRVALEDLKARAGRILAGESDMQALYHQHGVQATGVLVIEALATTAQSTAADVLAKLTWQDRQLEIGDELAVKLEQDRAEVDRRNTELGYDHFRAPGVDYFTSGWKAETTEERTARASG